MLNNGSIKQNVKFSKSILIISALARKKEEKRQDFYESLLPKIKQRIQRNLEGLEDLKSKENFLEACMKADFIGGLPDRDSSPSKHIDLLFNLAKSLNKPVDIHVGQNNLPSEKETELVLDKIEEHSLKQKVSLVHCISLACLNEDYIRHQAKRMKHLDVNVIVCPSAAISMKQNHSIYSPIHNSIAPVRILLEENVNVKLGIDNIEDLFMPLVDGDMWFETRLLMESTRIYDINKIINIVT